MSTVHIVERVKYQPSVNSEITAEIGDGVIRLEQDNDKIYIDVETATEFLDALYKLLGWETFVPEEGGYSC